MDARDVDYLDDGVSSFLSAPASTADSFPDALAAARPMTDYLGAGIDTFLVLDYDGVINPYSSGTFSKAYFSPDNYGRDKNPFYDKDASLRGSGGLRVKSPKSFASAWSSDLVARLSAIAARPNVLVVFLCTMKFGMGAVVKSIGFTSANTPVYLPWDGDDHALKIAAFRDYFAGVPDYAKCVWIDDLALSDAHGALLPAYGDDSPLHGNFGARGLLVSPDSSYGISVAEMDLVDTFLPAFSPKYYYSAELYVDGKEVVITSAAEDMQFKLMGILRRNKDGDYKSSESLKATHNMSSADARKRIEELDRLLVAQDMPDDIFDYIHSKKATLEAIRKSEREAFESNLKLSEAVETLLALSPGEALAARHKSGMGLADWILNNDPHHSELPYEPLAWFSEFVEGEFPGYFPTL